MTEFDYEHEALSLATVAANIEPHFPEVRVPHPVPALCTRDVLVMEYLPGEKLLTAIQVSVCVCVCVDSCVCVCVCVCVCMCVELAGQFLFFDLK
jgi:hypothetical protein